MTVVRIVIITSVVVAATSAAVSQKFDGYSRIGGIIGTTGRSCSALGEQLLIPPSICGLPYHTLPDEHLHPMETPAADEEAY